MADTKVQLPVRTEPVGVVKILEAMLLELRRLTDMFLPKRVEMLEPFTLTTTTSKQAVFAQGENHKLVKLEMHIRSIGTATYVGVGTFHSQDFRMDATMPYRVIKPPERCYIDGKGLTIISDAADCVVEFQGYVMG
jgi:hypothetical protein